MSVGAVILPLACAQVQDVDNVGLECWYAGMMAGDSRRPLAEQRLHCYDLILDSLSVFEEKCSKQQNADGTSMPPVDEPETVRSHAYELAFASEDEMFHSTLYDWLIQRNLADDLLEVCFHGTIIFISMSLTFHIDETCIPGSASQTRTCDCPKIPIAMAILCEEWTTTESS